MIPNVPISVLLSTYGQESSERLQRALDSIRDQTLAPAEVVLVVDGPVDMLQEAVIENCSSIGYLGVPTKVIRLEKNGGLANALNVGLRRCVWPWVARMDSDDVAAPERFERQWQYLRTHNDVDLLCSWHRECGPDGAALGRIKRIPERHEQIIKGLRWRNIISHPTVMFRRHMVISVGGYETGLSRQEDYELYVRLAVKGARFAACQAPLVDVTTNRQQRIRRGGVAYLIQSEWPTRWRMVLCGFISLPFAIVSAILRTTFVLSPSSLKWFLYGFVRSKDRSLKEMTEC